MAGMTHDLETTHKDLQDAQVKSTEARVGRMIEAFQNFSDPFQIEGPTLFCISSGMPAPHEVEDYLLQVDAIGKVTADNFMKERLQEKSKSFHAPLKRFPVKTFASTCKKKKVTSSENKTMQIAAQRDLFGNLLVVAQKHDISLEKIMTFPMSPVPWALGTPDGQPVKTDKSKLMHLIETSSEACQETPNTAECTSVMDGMALLHAFHGLPDTFSELADKILCILPASQRVDFVTDIYNRNSIKAAERCRRGHSDTLLLKGGATKVPKDWKGFLSNGKNKTQLISLLQQEWRKDRNASRLQGKELFLTTGQDCIKLTSDGKTVQCENVESLKSSQEEADTRLVLHCLHQAASCPAAKAIIVRSSDTDVFLLLLYHSFTILKTVYLDTGVGNHRRIINITDLALKQTQPKCNALLGIYAFSGCDSTSSFVRKGKKTVMKITEKNPRFLSTFGELGQPQVSQHVHQQLESFTCCLYGRPQQDNINQLHVDLFRER